MSDLRYAVRTLLKNPGFTLIAILTLALGIGANTAMFAVVNAVLLKPLPFSDPDRLMLVHLLVPERESGARWEGVWSYPKYRSFLEMQDVFDNTALFAGRDITLTGDADPVRIRGEVTTERYPGVLGVHPILGRSFTGREANIRGEPPVVMIGHALWTRRYGADPGIVGHTIGINSTPYTVIGVLPPDFRGLSGNAEIWVPFAAFEPSYLTERYAHGYFLVARHKSTVSETQTIARVRAVGDQLAQEYREFGGESWGATATSLYSSRIEGDLRLAALMLLGAVSAVLLIACVNLTNLLIAKALGRRREIAVRLAIGASRFQVARQFVVESLLLTGLGATAGLFVASVLLAAGGTLLPESDAFFRMAAASPGAGRISGAQGLTLVGAGMIGLDGVSILVACGIAVGSAGLISLVPAVQSSALRPLETLKSGRSGRPTEKLKGFGTRGALVTAQITIALVVLAGAGLMLKSAARLHATAIGVDPEGVLTARIDLPGASYNEERRILFFSQLIERVRSVPGVESFGIGNCPPVSGGCNSTIIGFEPGRHRVTPDAPGIGVHFTSPEYFRSLGIRLVRGRLLNEQDRMGRPKVVLVSESAARKFWPNADPVGKSVTLGQGSGFREGAEVVGVVSDVRYRAIESSVEPDAYISVFQSPPSRVRFFIQSRLDPESLITALRREIAALDPNLPLSEVKTMEQRVGDAMWRTRIASWVFSAFGVLALLLTAIGIFGVMSQTVAQETSDIGIRMALGARTGQVLTLVLRRVAVVTLAGIGIGLVLALAMTRLTEALLYDVKPNDPSTFVVVSLVMGVVALAASYIPARRATRVNPITALRYE
jgi:putative ABC transport system permease protein